MLTEYVIFMSNSNTVLGLYFLFSTHFSYDISYVITYVKMLAGCRLQLLTSTRIMNYHGSCCSAVVFVRIIPSNCLFRYCKVYRIHFHLNRFHCFSRAVTYDRNRGTFCADTVAR